MKGKLLTSDEKKRMKDGTWLHSYEKLGAHLVRRGRGTGCRFAVWAPGAKSVHVVGDFNDWDVLRHEMKLDADGEIWQLFIPGIEEGDLYKYVIETQDGKFLYKADPYAFWAEKVPETASRVCKPESYTWKDAVWMNRRNKKAHMQEPLNIYEVHLGSWKRHEDESYYTYDELSEELVEYVSEMGYTHIELMPVMEHPFDGSWGYQITSYYAPTSRYGTPQEFKHFIDTCHRAGIGVILDWVPAHFCRDAHGLGNFVGQKLYEDMDHAQWGTYTFNFGRGEVRTFLLSNLTYWIEEYHADGIRVDGVTSMLYLNFGVDDPSKKRFNVNGTEENLEAVAFVQDMNRVVGEQHSDVMLIAEESTAWPLVTRPPESGGLGFHYKWDMGWMNDTLNYMKTDFPYRPYNHNLLTFSMMYAFNENFILPLSHDEVVHGKCSLIGRMPGDYWRQFAGLRVLTLYQMCHPGGKLNFMGNEIGQFIEWRYYEGIEWFLAKDYEHHAKHQAYIRELNHFYKEYRAMWLKSYDWDGFEWLDADNNEQSVLTFIRHGKTPMDDLIVVINFTPETYEEYRVGVPKNGVYGEVFNSDKAEFGGSGFCNSKPVKSEKEPMHGMSQSVSVRIPPIGGLVLKRLSKRQLAD
jgi:1,4-alpha-glucan branching enzyme